MFKIFHSFIKNLFLVTIPSIVIFILFFELIVFRFIFPASDIPYRSVIVSADDVVRYDCKNSGMYQEGVFRRGFSGEIKGHYRINSDGWNSDREYSEQKSGEKRIAIIGDSYVEALQVDTDKSIAEILKKDLKRYGEDNVEVYRFGQSGAPLSQYLQMMRYVVKKYHPDIVVVNIVANDFIESIHGFANRYGDYLQIRRKGSAWVEVKPEPYVYTPDPRQMLLKRSAMVRFFLGNLEMQRRLNVLYDRFNGVDIHEKFHMNIDKNRIIKELPGIKSLCYYIFSRFKETTGPDTKLLLVMDANRLAIYEGKDPRKEELYALTMVVRDTAQELEIPFVDLNDAFFEDYKKNKRRFSFNCDGHWNERGHMVAGRTVSEFIRVNKWCGEP